MSKAFLLLSFFMPLFIVGQTIPDTLYSGQVTTYTSVSGFNLEGAEVSFTINDTVNNTFELITFGSTDANGEYMVDSLPVLKYSTGTDNPIIKQVANEKITVTNNGIGSNHKITISGFVEVNKDAYIIDLTGQQVAALSLHQNPTNKSFETIWNGEKTKNGLYLFYVKSNIGILAKKILHLENKASGNYYPANSFRPSNHKSSNAITEDEAISKYIRTITSQFTENYEDTVYVYENMQHYFDAELEHLPINPTSMNGEILVNGEFPAYNTNIQIKNLNNQSIIFNIETDENGNYTQDGMPIPIDAIFTAPETSQYEIKTTAVNPANFEEKIEIIDMVSGENLLHNISVEANPINPAEVTGQVLLNGETPIANANLHWKNLNEPSITYDITTNTQGEYEEDIAVPLDALFTNPENSEYEVTTTGDILETKIDTLLVVSGEQALNNILVFPLQYANGAIQALLRYEDDNQGVGLADVEYKQLENQSQIFTTTTTTNGAYTLNIPVIYEPENPGQTAYIVTYEPSENTNPAFFAKVDTILISPNSNNFIHYVEKNIVEPTQDIEGVVRDAYTKDLASGITVRLIDRTTGQVIEEEFTGPDGKYFFEDLAQGSQFEFELGADNHFWVYNTEYDVPSVIVDTLISFNRLAYPKDVEVPMPGTNYTIVGVGEEVSEMYGGDCIVFEEILRNEDNMYATNPNNPEYLAVLQYLNDSIYEGNGCPIITVSTSRNITPEMQATYDPYTNFFPGELGWNIDFGGGNHVVGITLPTPYSACAVLGGEIEATGSSSISPVIKEMQGRRLYLGDVVGPLMGGRISLMNNSSSMPTEKDRAYIKLILINQKARFANEQETEETYSLEYLTDEDPSGDKLMNGKKYFDIPGTKPHCKDYFNYKK